MADQAIYPGTVSPEQGFTVEDAETSATALLVTAVSSDTNLLPVSGILLGGVGTNRTIQLQPTPELRGTSVVTVVVTDSDKWSSSNSFTLRVEEFTPLASGLYRWLGRFMWGDYDNDGWLDLVYAGSGQNRVMRNLGNGTFSDILSAFPAWTSTYGSAVWGDYDRDSNLDVVLAGSLPSKLCRNLGNGTFTNIALPSLPFLQWLAGALSWGDYDNDGDLDLLISGENVNYNDVSRVFRNDGSNTFVDIRAGLVGVEGPSAFVDYDRDGCLDVLVTGFSLGNGRMTRLYRNNGNGSFSGAAVGLPPLAYGSADMCIAWGDFDNDGDPDLFLSGEDASGVWLPRLFRNDGQSLFTEVQIGLPTSMSQGTWGDYDNDGWLDLAVNAKQAGYTNSTTLIFRNDGHGMLTNIGVQLRGPLYNSPPERFTWADYDRDGDLDLLSEDGAIIYRNNCAISNRPPNAPTGSSASIQQNNGAILTWSPALDNETTNSSGLTYNLRMGTSPNGINIITPHADAATGRRRLAAFGLITSNAWHIFDLPKGTYYWSVQAIDPGLAGSPFAAESSFAITNARPTTSAISNQTNSHITPFITVNFTTSDEETAASNLLVTASSADTNVIPNDHLVLSNFGTNRALTIYPVTNKTGVTTVTVISHDEGGNTFDRPFVVKITNCPPTISNIPDQVIPANTATATIPFTIGDGDGPVSQLRVSLSSSNPFLIPLTNIDLGGTGSSPTVTIHPLPYQTGVATISVAVADAAGDWAEDSFLVTVQQFTDIPTALPAITNGALAWGDFDNDNDLDLLIAGSGLTRIYRNNGSNSFSDIFAGLPGVTNGAVAWGDFNNDGWLDFALAGSGISRVYRNNGNGTFTNMQFSLTGLSLSSVAWGDYDNDGRLDLLQAGSTTGSTNATSTRIYRNVGGITLSNINANLPGVCLGTVAWGDYDSDGDLDILICGYSSEISNNLTRVYRNDAGLFTDVGAGLPGVNFGAAAWGDMDGDGDLDIALTGSTKANGTDGIVRAYRNQGSGVFQNVAFSSDELARGTVTWVDFDNDGDLDLIFTGRQTYYPNGIFTRTYQNNGNGVFSLFALALPDCWSSALATGDFDKDGDLDFLATGFTNLPFTKLLRNNIAFTNTPPIIPANLAAVVQENQVTLSWTESEDLQTTNANLIRYAVRVGTNNDTVNTSSPHADPVSGYRRVPEFAQLSRTNLKTLRALLPGTYYWNVQAIDTAFAGSAFASETSFVVTNHPPVANPQLVVTTEDTTQVIALTGSDVDGQSLTFTIVTPPTNGVLTDVPPNVSYRPNANYFGSDSFLFAAIDGMTNSSPATVSLIIAAAPDVTNAYLALAPLPGGQCQLSFNGEPFERYRIDTSQDLVHWAPLTNFILTNLPMSFVDWDAANYSNRFYRPVWIVPVVQAVGPWISSSGQFQFQVGGDVGRVFRISASTNLVDWTTLANLVLTNALTLFLDPSATNYKRRFYRVTPP